MRPFAYERPTHLGDAVALLAEHGPDARLLAGGTDLIIRLRDGTIRPRVVVDVKGIAELDGGDQGSRRVPAVRRPDGHDGHRRGRASPARSSRPRRGGGRRRLGPDPEPGHAGGQPLQCLARRRTRHRPCSSTTRASSRSGRLGRRPSRSTSSSSGRASRRWPAASSSTAIELPRPATRPRGTVHVRRTRRRGHDLASVTLACAVADDGSTRIAYGSLGPRPLLVVDDSGLLADPTASGPARSAIASRRCSPTPSPSPRSLRASPDYRLAMLHVLGLRAVATAIARLAGVMTRSRTPIELTVNGAARATSRSRRTTRCSRSCATTSG